MKWLMIFAAGVLLAAGCVSYHPRPLSPESAAAAFASRSLTNDDLRAFFETNQVSGEWPRRSWGLTELTLAAFYYQPSLVEARAQVAAVQASRITADQRPNPTFSATPGYDSQIPGAPSPWLVTLSVDVPIETAGKRGKRVALADRNAETAWWSFVSAAWQARSRVRTALVDLYAAREAESLLASQESAQSNVVRLLEGQLAAGAVSDYEVTQARVALATTRIVRQDFAGLRRQARIALANAVGVPSTALQGIEISFAELRQLPRHWTRPEVRRQALVNRADVRGALADYAASQAALQLEIANQYPDIHLGPGYGWNTGSAGDNEWTLGVSLNLPIFNHNQGPIAEAEAKRAQAAAHFLAVQAAAIGEIESALAGYQSALQQAAATESLRENLSKRQESVRSQAAAGEADPLALAGAEVEYGAGLQTRLDAMIKAQRMLGQLEDAVQSPLTLPPSVLGSAEQRASQELK